MSVSSKAAEEADTKHISGPAKKRYVGGAINRAKQEKATTAKKAAAKAAPREPRVEAHVGRIDGRATGVSVVRRGNGSSQVRPMGSGAKRIAYDGYAAESTANIKTDLQYLREIAIKEDLAMLDRHRARGNSATVKSLERQLADHRAEARRLTAELARRKK